MTKQVGLPMVVLFMSPLSFAQTRCPEGFRYAGTLSGTGSAIEAFSKRVELRLPENATLDTSYQQTRVRADNGQGNAHSNLRPQDIPKGIHIIPTGTHDLDKGWSVSDPQLKAVERSADGRITRYQFGMRLNCTVGSGMQQSGSCEVDVEVCYKPKK
jgi:hypothetical protein